VNGDLSGDLLVLYAGLLWAGGLGLILFAVVRRERR
jgi:hypothetical protein